MRVGAIVVARLDSRRLPRKALRDLGGRPMIAWAFDICRSLDRVDAVILATTDRPDDDDLADFALDCGVAIFRGDVNDVAGRFLAAMEKFELGAALRLNGDSPLNRPALLNGALGLFRAGGADVVSNVPGRTYPYGISAEVIGVEAMRYAHAAMPAASADREHVTQYFYRQSGPVRLRLMPAAAAGMSGVQLAVDDEIDLARAAWIMSRLDRPLFEASLQDLVRLSRAFDAEYASR